MYFYHNFVVLITSLFSESRYSILQYVLIVWHTCRYTDLYYVIMNNRIITMLVHIFLYNFLYIKDMLKYIHYSILTPKYLVLFIVLLNYCLKTHSDNWTKLKSIIEYCMLSFKKKAKTAMLKKSWSHTTIQAYVLQ